MTAGAAIAAGDNGAPTRLEVGRFQRQESGSAVVLVGEPPVELTMRATQWPQPGDEVHVACIAGTWVVLGPVKPKARTGRVTSVLTGSAIVEYPEGSGVTASMLTPTGMTLATGDKVLIDWSNGGIIVQRYSTQQEKPSTTPPPPPTGAPTTAVFRAAWSGSVTNAGYWTGTDVYSVVRGGGRGCWGYSSIKPAVSAGKTLLAARIFLPLTREGSLVTIGWHTLEQPTGTATLSGGVPNFDPSNGWQDLDPALAAQLLGGGPAQGLCIEGGSGTVVAGQGRDGMSGALELTWA